ncbi:DNA methyltransferase [uncultured Methanolobus sp.]|uniref:DNA methyltransferase n=1 Tax=uncultured Methanolobus sp. TaxID=218300 RepID=UPI0029C7584D|nr:DNA methyltransferase [uncultured Methanolobus sp.]
MPSATHLGRKVLCWTCFGGSGTTLIASHQLNRVCYGVELDPRYADVIIQRYINLTGNRELKRNGEDYTWEGEKVAQK